MANDNKLNTIAGSAFLSGSLAMTISMKAATSIVEPSIKPASEAAFWYQNPAIIPMDPAISNEPVKKLKKDGRPSFSNSFAIFPDMIVVPF